MNLDVNKIAYTYPNSTSGIKEASFSIGTGIHGLLGLNGAGKSTLLRIIAGIQAPESGRVELYKDESVVDAYQNSKEYKSCIGYLPQKFGAYPELTVESMLNFLCQLKGIRDKNARVKRVKYLLSVTGLEKYAEQKLGTFSGGMLQRYGIAQAIAGNPSILILDEPTVGLDTVEKDRFFDLLTELAQYSIVIFSSHTESDILELCDKVSVVNDGILTQFRNPNCEIDYLRGKLWRKKNELVEQENCEMLLIATFFRKGKEQQIYYVESAEIDLEKFGYEPVTPSLKYHFYYQLNK